jgi:hypothetical protein
MAGGFVVAGDDSFADVAAMHDDSHETSFPEGDERPKDWDTLERRARAPVPG